MFKSKKFAAAAGVLGSFALIGAAAVQAVAAENPGNCAEDRAGNVRCVQKSDSEITTEYGKVRFVNDSELTCSGSGEVSCKSSAVVGGKKP
ncbi:hypothetical protein GCM10010377_11220 [Streptomyces viridiviolaceus]|uniref:Uncharacterized protein n=1 Tax=Streptomyces viridiviolaceus TaxID=68282 RepID=A0ABW2ECF3_9ACTN|nr:hypothetical protein [Streptomyces viridiviolaceus]GHB23071.1 hypothetical protein GCM10010377_11220 [Streptomyces viridiviolaceus]